MAPAGAHASFFEIPTAYAVGSGSCAPAALFGTGPFRLQSLGYRFEAGSVDSLAPSLLPAVLYLDSADSALPAAPGSRKVM